MRRKIIALVSNHFVLGTVLIVASIILAEILGTYEAVSWKWKGWDVWAAPWLGILMGLGYILFGLLKR